MEDELRRFVSRNEYSTKVKIDQDSLEEVEAIADECDWVYVDECHRDEFDIPPSVTVEITVGLDERRGVADE